MIKNKSQRFFHLPLSVYSALFSLIFVFLALICLPQRSFLGFLLGGLSFLGAFSSLEAILYRIFFHGDLKKGVLSAPFWVCCKFFLPIGLIYSAVKLGGGPLWIFCGIVASLFSISAVFLIQHLFCRKVIEQSESLR